MYAAARVPLWKCLHPDTSIQCCHGNCIHRGLRYSWTPSMLVLHIISTILNRLSNSSTLIWLCVGVCVCVCECVFLCQSVSVCVCFFACLSVWLTGCVSQSVVSLKSVNYVSYPWVWLIGRVSVYVSLCLSLCVWLWMSVCVTLCLWLSVCVCVCMWFVYLCLTLLVGCLCIRWKRKVCLFIVLFV